MSKSGKTHYLMKTEHVRATLKKGGSSPDLGKAIARKMMALRLQGWTQQECEALMEEMCQEVERLEGEMLNDNRRDL